MSDERTYLPLPTHSSQAEILQILYSGDLEQLRLLGFSIGQNYHDGQFAQKICLELAEHSDSIVRANACMGLAYIARTKGHLDKRLVKPVLLRELRSQTEMNGRIVDAIEDINLYLGWKLAHKHVGSQHN